MTIQQTQQTRIAQELVERIRAAQGGTDTTVPTGILRTFLEEGERQLQGLHIQMKASGRKILGLEDRIQAQSVTIKRLKEEVQRLERQRK
jgi:hypothetical protein